MKNDHLQQLNLNTTMKLRGLASLLMGSRGTPFFRVRNIARFSEEENKNKNKLFTFVKSAWKQTFPDEEEQVRQKYSKVKEQKRFTKEELQKIHAETPEYLKGALVSSKEQPVQQKEGFKISSLIPDSVKSKIKETPQFKEYEVFKENFKEYVSTREGALANAGTTVYSKIAQGSPEARATGLMRQYIPDFSLYELEEESTVIFKNAFHAYLNFKLSDLEMMASEQGYEYFSAHTKMYRTKKWKPKYTEIVFNYPAQLTKARVGENLIPKFDFHIKIIHIYCFIDGEGNIVEGGDDRVQSSVFEFSLTYNGEHVAELGHPWTLCEIKEIEKMKMLV